MASSQGQPTGIEQTLNHYWPRLWSPQTDSSQAQGWSFVYAEDGSSLLGEYPMEPNPASPPTLGAQHIWLPTASGPMPIAVVGEGRQYAVHTDHLNTPRRLTQEDGQVAWQWAYSAFGDEAPTQAATRFTSESTSPSTGSTAVPQVNYNLRYPGQYFDKESNLHYNYFRSYDSRMGRYTQADPIGLDGGWNGFSYAKYNPLSSIDPLGLFIVTVGINVRLPFVGGATHSVGLSYLDGKWDAGIIIESDVVGLSYGKLMGRTTVDFGVQKGDFCSNDKSYQQNLQIGAKGLGGSIQRDEHGFSGIGVSFGPQLGASISGEQTRVWSIRNNLIPWIRN